MSDPHDLVISPDPPQTFRQWFPSEFRPLFELALPVAGAEVAWMAMGLVDTLLLGRVSPEALGGMALANGLFFFCMMLGMGLLFGLDYVVSVHQGAGRALEGRKSAVQGVWIAVFMTPVLMGVVLVGRFLLTGWGPEPEVIRYAQAFLDVVIWSLAPLLIFTALRRYLQSIGVVGPSLVIVVLANVINAGVGWVLIFGHFGFAPLEAVGAGWATTLARLFMMMGFMGVLWWRARRYGEDLEGVSLKPDPTRLKELLVLGGPAAVQAALEVGMFATTTVMAGLLPASSLAAHQIALSICSFTFMVPWGISQAGAVRVGFRLGEGDGQGASRAGWCALVLGAGFMVCSATALVLGRHTLVGWFTTDAETASQATGLLVLAAIFQVFDGLQVVATGVLRGAGDTATPARVNLVGNWLLGVPVAYIATFPLGMGVSGLWVGLLVGLVSVGCTLLLRWRRVTFTLQTGASLRTVASIP